LSIDRATVIGEVRSHLDFALRDCFVPRKDVHAGFREYSIINAQWSMFLVVCSRWVLIV